MLYHSERIYGIDISKYQHKHRHRTYGIDWRNLRITRLGHTADRNALGAVDYPVSFVYIKSTEGLTVFNPYYTQDVRAARRYGFPVGAYHFFSTRPAMCQADYFLKKSRLRKGDLPPMLDVELSDRRIAAMGGRDVLFREMLVWLKEVGRRSGTTPIIYVSQDFVNRYMPFAPEELKKYPVWGGPLRGVQAIRAFALLAALARRSGTRYPGRCGHRRVQRFGGAVQEVFADANREVNEAFALTVVGRVRKPFVGHLRFS